MNSFEKPENLNRELNKAARYEQKKAPPYVFTEEEIAERENKEKAAKEFRESRTKRWKIKKLAKIIDERFGEESSS
ncbi:MAG: hypothetical protein QG583_821 [Patescibacteria group bacterium]|nr:hypothetical protein [Patescibacteria group bacterium]